MTAEPFGTQLRFGASFTKHAREGAMSADSFCGWPVRTGVSWIQTREPQLARKLTKRSDTRLVAAGVSGGFLRVFEIRRSPSFVRRLITRYEAANERFRDLQSRGKPRNGAGE